MKKILFFAIIILILTQLTSCFKGLESEDQLFFYELIENGPTLDEANPVVMEVEDQLTAFKYGFDANGAGERIITRVPLDQRPQLAENEPLLNRFLPMSEYEEGITPEPYKVEIVFHSVNDAGNPNVNIRFLQRLGHPDWQGRYNPVNFQFPNTTSDEDLAQQIAERVVMLSFMP